MKPTNIREAEYRRNIWSVTVDKDVDPKALLQPSFWAHVSGRMKPNDRIEVHAFTGAWFAELMVRSSGRTEAIVALMRFVDLDKADVAAKELNEADPLEAVHRGGAKWSVRRKSDNAILVEKLETKEQALDWIKNPPAQQQAA